MVDPSKYMIWLMSKCLHSNEQKLWRAQKVILVGPSHLTSTFIHWFNLGGIETNKQNLLHCTVFVTQFVALCKIFFVVTQVARVFNVWRVRLHNSYLFFSHTLFILCKTLCSRNNWTLPRGGVLYIHIYRCSATSSFSPTSTKPLTSTTLSSSQGWYNGPLLLPGVSCPKNGYAYNTSSFVFNLGQNVHTFSIKHLLSGASQNKYQFKSWDSGRAMYIHTW